MKLVSLSHTLRLVAVGTILIASSIPLCGRAQGAATSSISYTVSGASADGKSASITLTATNTLPAGTPATTASISGTTSENPPRTITGTVAIAAVSNLIASPTLSVALPPATASAAGLAAPTGSLPAGVTVSGNVLTWTPGKLDGGQSVTLTVAGFSVIQPVAAVSANPGANSR